MMLKKSVKWRSNMGLNKNSTGFMITSSDLIIKKKENTDKVIALAGNPNVGKSTLFNQLTGLKQHTGNWPGKTVANAQGYCSYENTNFVLVDIPGCYSLMAHSAEEEIARDFICFQQPDAVCILCDATCLERNLNLVLQILEVTSHVVVCVNLMDEAKKKRIHIDIEKLQSFLQVPVLGITARKKHGLHKILEQLCSIFSSPSANTFFIPYEPYIEEAISMLSPVIEVFCKNVLPIRWLCARLLDANPNFLSSLEKYLGYSLPEKEAVKNVQKEIQEKLSEQGISMEKLQDDIASAFVKKAEVLSKQVVSHQKETYHERDRQLDRLFTSKLTGFPIMFLLLFIIFWITIVGANYPSTVLNRLLFSLEDTLFHLLYFFKLPDFLCNILILGVYRVLAWVVSVMLPPMAIFFPLFTLLEDSGYLPRIAFNLDRCFQKCCTCGKQALTMCMGFGCNAAGIVGCRIIDSPRERLIAIITNSFIPCNGRFPILITILSLFFIGSSSKYSNSFLCAFLLAAIIIFSILITFFLSYILSKTMLKGLPSSFTLELPPYRRPQTFKVIIHSIFDRTLFVLGRAVAVAAPAGLLIYLMANIQIGELTLLAHSSNFLDPFGRLLGMDGVILLAFILGFPANEIVIPIIIMAYMANGSLIEINDLHFLRQLLIENGWTWITAVSTMIFCLMHWPCSTTCLTIKKETQSLKWTIISFLVPTITGIIFCFLFTSAAKFFLSLL